MRSEWLSAWAMACDGVTNYHHISECADRFSSLSRLASTGTYRKRISRLGKCSAQFPSVGAHFCLAQTQANQQGRFEYRIGREQGCHSISASLVQLMVLPCFTREALRSDRGPVTRWRFSIQSLSQTTERGEGECRTPRFVYRGTAKSWNNLVRIVSRPRFEASASQTHVYSIIALPASSVTTSSGPGLFNLSCSRTARSNFSSALYVQSCWCIIQAAQSIIYT